MLRQFWVQILVVVLIVFVTKNSSAQTICNRSHIATVPIYDELVDTIHEYFGSENVTQPPAVILEKIYDIIWPNNQTSSQWYCVDELINGNVNPGIVKNCSAVLDGFRSQISSIISLFRQPEQPHGDILRRALKDLHVNISYHFNTFLQVMDIETGSLFIREFSILLFGSSAEYVNYCRFYCPVHEAAKWRRRSLPPTSFIMAKYSYWLLR